MSQSFQSPNGNTRFVKDGPAKASPICGGAVLERLVARPSPARNDNKEQQQSPSCMVPSFRRGGYAQINGGLTSPDTKSVSSHGGGSSKDEMEYYTDELPSYIVQFNPQQQSNGSMVSILKSTSIWSNPLPALAEVDSVDERSIATASSAKSKTMTARNSVLSKFTVKEKDEMLISMRKLILEQQVTVQELAEESSSFKRQAFERQEALVKLNEERKQQKELIEELQKKVTALQITNENLSYRLETAEDYIERSKGSDMKAYGDFKAIHRSKDTPKPDDDAVMQPSHLVRKATEIRQNGRKDKSKTEESTDEISAFRQSKEKLMNDERFLKSLQIRSTTVDETAETRGDSEMPRDVGQVFRLLSHDNDVSENEPVEPETEKEKASRYRQKIDLFKQRLQDVQLKRSQKRPVDGKRNPIVRFKDY